jgi:hypothetical protein
MGNLVRSAVLAATLAASTLVAGAPAQARDYYYRHHRGGDDAAIAIGAGLVGLAIGAAIASDGRHGRYYDGYYDSGYYNRGYYPQGYAYPRYQGYYYDSYPRYRSSYRYDRYDRYERKHRKWHRRHGY